jgi:hypothetical protein
MHRQPEHVIQFLFAEMGTTGSVDGAGRLVIKGRFQQKQVENVLRRYIGKTLQRPDRSILTTPHDASGIRYMQNLQISRYTSDEGKSHLLHVVRVLWIAAFGKRHQEWFPGADWEEEQEPDRLKCTLIVSLHAPILQFFAPYHFEPPVRHTHWEKAHHFSRSWTCTRTRMLNVERTTRSRTMSSSLCCHLLRHHARTPLMLTRRRDGGGSHQPNDGSASYTWLLPS